MTVIKSIFRTLVSAVAVVAGLGAFNSHAFAETYQCHPSEVSELAGSRIHVICSNPYVFAANHNITIRFIAIGVADHSAASRFVSLATTALVSGKDFFAEVSTDASGNTPGCLSADCRTPTKYWIAN